MWSSRRNSRATQNSVCGEQRTRTMRRSPGRVFALLHGQYRANSVKHFARSMPGFEERGWSALSKRPLNPTQRLREPQRGFNTFLGAVERVQPLAKSDLTWCELTS